MIARSNWLARGSVALLVCLCVVSPAAAQRRQAAAPARRPDRSARQSSAPVAYSAARVIVGDGTVVAPATFGSEHVTLS